MSVELFFLVVRAVFALSTVVAFSMWGVWWGLGVGALSGLIVFGLHILDVCMLRRIDDQFKTY